MRADTKASKTTPSPAVSVVILAGGLSRRMGQDKALLPGRGGRPLLCQTVETARHLSPEIVIVTPWPERYRPLLLDQTVRFVKERLDLPSKGPLAGFAQGFAQVSSQWCLLLACDLPYLEPSVLQRWWQSLERLSAVTRPESLQGSDSRPSGRSGESTQPLASLVPINPSPVPFASSQSASSPKGFKTQGEKQWEPLCGFYHRRCLPSLYRYLEGDGRSFQRWLKDVPVAPFYDTPDNMLFNCNTPADWATISL